MSALIRRMRIPSRLLQPLVLRKAGRECRSVRHRRAVAGRCAFLSGGVPERGWWGGCCVEGDVLESEIVVERDKSRFIVQKRDLSEVNEL